MHRSAQHGRLFVLSGQVSQITNEQFTNLLNILICHALIHRLLVALFICRIHKRRP